MLRKNDKLYAINIDPNPLDLAYDTIKAIWKFMQTNKGQQNNFIIIGWEGLHLSMEGNDVHVLNIDRAVILQQNNFTTNTKPQSERQQD